MTMLALISLFVCIIMPLAMAWRIWRLNEPTRTAWLIKVVEGMLFTAFILIVGRWDVAGYYTRFILLALLVTAILLSWRRHADRPWHRPDDTSFWRNHWSMLLSPLFFSAILLYAASGFIVRDEPKQLAFPLEGGRFIVGQGGGNTLLNYHASHRAQLYAADILAINSGGFRSTGLHPADPGRFVIWGATVVSPCDAQVVSVRDGQPDLRPPASDRKNPAGNHVVLLCDGIHVELAHLRKGSIVVRPGDRLKIGDRIAAVGNSGNTSEPHLHIHAVDPDSGEGIPLAFDGRVPVRNRIFRK